MSVSPTRRSREKIDLELISPPSKQASKQASKFSPKSQPRTGHKFSTAGRTIFVRGRPSDDFKGTISAAERPVTRVTPTVPVL